MPIKPIHSSSSSSHHAPVTFTSDPLAWVSDAIQQIGSCSFIGTLTSGCFSEQGRFTLIQYSLVGAAGLGTMGTVILLISGLPAVAGLVGALTAASGTGAWMAYQAADQWALKQSIDDIKVVNADLRKQAGAYKKQNRSFKGKLGKMGQENDRLQTNVAQMGQQVGALSAQVSHHAQNNVDQKAQIDRLEESLGIAENHQEQLGKRNVELVAQVGQLSNLASAFKEQLETMKGLSGAQKKAIKGQVVALETQIATAKGLWEQMIREDQGLLQGNLVELRGIIEKTTAAWVQEQGTLMQHVREAQAHLQGMRDQEMALGKQVAAAQGQLQAFAKAFEDLKNSYSALLEKHGELVSESTEQQKTQGELNSTLAQRIQDFDAVSSQKLQEVSALAAAFQHPESLRFPSFSEGIMT